MKSTLTIMMMMAAGLASAQTVHKCVDESGNPVFQQTPCPTGRGAPIAVQAPRASTGAGGLREGEQKMVQQIEADRSARQAAAELERKRQEELAVEQRKAAAAEREATAEEEQARAANRRYFIKRRVTIPY